MSDFEKAALTEEIWGSNWKLRIYERIQTLGFRDLAEFLKAYPAESYSMLAKRLGKSVAPLQVIQLQFIAAVASGAIRAAAALTREIKQQTKTWLGVQHKS